MDAIPVGHPQAPGVTPRLLAEGQISEAEQSEGNGEEDGEFGGCFHGIWSG